MRPQEKNETQILEQNSESDEESEYEKNDFCYKKKIMYDTEESDLELEKLSQDSNIEIIQKTDQKSIFYDNEGFSEADIEDQ